MISLSFELPPRRTTSGSRDHLVVFADSFDGANGCQTPQIAPAVSAVELARLVEQPFRSERFVEATGRILAIGTHPHRGDALGEKPTDDVTDEATPQSLALVFTQKVDLA